MNEYRSPIGDHVRCTIIPTAAQCDAAVRAFCKHQELDPDELIVPPGYRERGRRADFMYWSMMLAIQAAHIVALEDDPGLEVRADQRA